MSKKTLNEATVRQFMKLVNHDKATISSFISENYAEEKEQMEETVNEEEEVNEVYNEEEEVAEMAPAMEAEVEDADPVGEPSDPADGGMEEAGAGEVDITPEMAEVLIELGDMLKGAMPDAGDDMGDMPDMDAAPMADEPAPAGDDAVMEAEETTNEENEVNEEEMVQEVARRVAARILKAKRAANK